MNNKTEVNFGCFRCVGLILMCMLIWALIFGVTYGGVHHGVTCGNGSQGVVIE
jgi:hypothetical protein